MKKTNKAFLALFIVCFVCLLTGCSYTYSEKTARKDAEKYIKDRCQSANHSVLIIDEIVEEMGTYISYTYVCQTDDSKYTFNIHPYRVSFEMPFSFTLPFIKVRQYTSNFEKTIMNELAKDKVFSVNDLSESSLLGVVKEMHEFADDMRKEVNEYGADDYLGDYMVFTAKVRYMDTECEYLYHSLAQESHNISDSDIAKELKELLEAK